MSAEEEIKCFVEERFGTRGVTVKKLAGDASDRSYFRALPAAGDIAGHASIVAMYLSAPADENLPFLSMQRLLADMGLPCPPCSPTTCQATSFSSKTREAFRSRMPCKMRTLMNGEGCTRRRLT